MTAGQGSIDGDLLAVFLPEARGYLAEMATGDREARVHAAHGLRGACAMLGLTQLAAEAEVLEDLLRSGADGDRERQRIERALDSLATGTPQGMVAPAESEWDPDELRGLRAFFLDEAGEHLEAIAAGLQALCADPAASGALLTILRKLHTFKGSAGSVQLPDLATIAHALEDRVVALRGLGVPPSAEALAALEVSTQALRLRVAQVEREVRHGEPAPEPGEPDRVDRGQVDRRLDADAQTVRVEVERIDELMDAASELVFDRTRITRRLQGLDACVRDLTHVQGELEHAAAGRSAEYSGGPEATRLAEIAAELRDVLGSLSRAADDLGEDAEGLRRTSATLQEGIRRVRMMSIGRLLQRLAQPLRELARREGKQLRYVTFGEETEIDKAVVERVAEPLLHLLRNAVAHGIEPPSVRRALEKPVEGTISVTARHAGDAVEIVVADDGHGIDVEAVRRALVLSGRAQADAALALDEASLFQALFEPGVSTRVSADDLAGRGVGLDAVRDAIARLGGTVRLTSTLGRGAAFTVRLPLTTAVQQAFLFKVGGQVYAVPAARVQEAVPITVADVRRGPGPETVTLPGVDAPRELLLVRLGALLGVPAPPGSSPRRAAIVLVSPQGEGNHLTFAVTCDKVIGPREIVVRSLGPLLAGLPLYAGATISGAGKVQLILDVAHLAEHARRGVTALRPTRALGPRRVLVVDDSRAIRETAQLILTQGGYAVESVPDGWDAWELLQDRPFDLLLTDLEMPRLDGHELIGKIRRSAELSDLPIVVISSRAGDAMHARAIEGGATRFVPKPLRKRPLLDALEAAFRGTRGDP